MPRPSCLTIVLDCLQDLHKSNILFEQVQDMFDARDFMYLKLRDPKEFSFSLDKKEQTIRNAVEFRRSIADNMDNTFHVFHVTIFVDVKTLDQTFLQQMINFCRETKALISGMHTEAIFFFHVCKDDQDGEQYLIDQFDALVQINQKEQLGTIFLLDYLWNIRTIKPWFGATARFMHVIAQDEHSLPPYDAGRGSNRTLVREIQTMLGTANGGKPALFANCRMTRLDDEDVADKQKRVEEIQALLGGERPEFPINVLTTTYANIIENETRRYLSRFAISENEVPIPANSFGCFLKRKKNEPNLNDLKVALQEIIAQHVKEAVLMSEPSSDEDLIRALKDGIPNGCIGDIWENINRIIDSGEPCETNYQYQVDLSYCAKESQLREQIRREIENAKTSAKFKSLIRGKINQRLLTLTKQFRNVILTQEERRQKEEELDSLIPVLDRNGYFIGITTINGIQDGAYAIDCSIGQEMTFMLISSRVAKQWNGVVPSILAQSIARPIQVYDYQNLQMDEFQTLSLRVWDQKTYDQYKNRIFHIKDGD